MTKKFYLSVDSAFTIKDLSGLIRDYLKCEIYVEITVDAIFSVYSRFNSANYDVLKMFSIELD